MGRGIECREHQVLRYESLRMAPTKIFGGAVENCISIHGGPEEELSIALSHRACNLENDKWLLERLTRVSCGSKEVEFA